jgi:hypothetical protein
MGTRPIPTFLNNFDSEDDVQLRILPSQTSTFNEVGTSKRPHKLAKVDDSNSHLIIVLISMTIMLTLTLVVVLNFTTTHSESREVHD